MYKHVYSVNGEGMRCSPHGLATHIVAVEISDRNKQPEAPKLNPAWSTHKIRMHSTRRDLNSSQLHLHYAGLMVSHACAVQSAIDEAARRKNHLSRDRRLANIRTCLLYTSDAADE